jgi:hypothetical protein
MPQQSKPEWDDLRDDDTDREAQQLIREEVADAARGRGPLPWVLLLACLVVAWIVIRA